MQAFGRNSVPSLSGPGRMMGVGGGVQSGYGGGGGGFGNMMGMGGGLQALLNQLRGLQGGQMPIQNPMATDPRYGIMAGLRGVRTPPGMGTGEPDWFSGGYGRGISEPPPPPITRGTGPYAPDRGPGGGSTYQVSEPPPMPGAPMGSAPVAGGMQAGGDPLQEAYRTQLATQFGGGGEASLGMLGRAGMGGNQGGDYAAMYGGRVGANQGVNMTGDQQQLLQQDARRRAMMNPAIMRMMGRQP